MHYIVHFILALNLAEVRGGRSFEDLSHAFPQPPPPRYHCSHTSRSGYAEVETACRKCLDDIMIK